MTDTTISAFNPAQQPLSDEMVPCVQGGENRRAPAAAFGIPVAGTTPPDAIAQYQSWIDENHDNPTLSVYLAPHWKPLYSFDDNGAMTFASPVSLADGDDLGSAVILRGGFDCSSAPDYPAADLGDFYVVSSAGKIGGAAGIDVEPGDTLLCMIDGSDSGDQVTVGANWTIGQGNIDGAVTGPASASNGHFAQFSGTTGKAVQDGGLSFSTDGTFASNSDVLVPSQKSVKTYVDTVAQGLDIKPSVKAASTAGLTHSAEQTIDGIACVSGDRVLDKNNASPALNGIWIVSTGPWTRAADMDAWSEVPGAFCFVEQGTVNGNSGWTCTADQGGTLGTTAIPWTQFSGAGTYTAGSGIALSGTQFSAVIGSTGGSEAWSAELDAVAALGSTGLVSRTAAHTYTPRSLTAPSAGFAITNADGVAGNPSFALANDLLALESLSSTGIAVRTGFETWAQRSLVPPSSGFTVGNADGSAGNPFFTLSDDLMALENLASTGIAVRTGASTWTQRAITGTSNEITVSNGDGVSAAPTLGLPASLTFTGKTVTGGTFSSPAAITGLLDPTNAQDVATKHYVDSVAQGLDVKPSVKVASTASLTHSGTQTIDGVACVAGDRVLDKNNASAALNGIWVVASGAWLRATDMDDWSEIPGAFCFVEQGTLNANTGWTCTSDQGGTLGTTAITWSQFAGPGTFTAGSGLSLSGTQFSAVIGSTGGSEAWSAELDAVAALSTTGLVARTGAHTYAPRTLQGPSAGNGLSVTNGDGVAGNPTIAPSDDLAALEALASTGIAVRTGTSTWAQRSLVAPISGFTVGNADGSAGNPFFTLSDDLMALENLASTGIAVRTGASTWTQRAITGTSGEIAVSNGDGVSAAPTLGLPASLTFTGKTVTGGTFSSPAINTLSDPVASQDAANKNYVDNSILGLDVKPCVKAASTSSLTHSGTQTIDGISCLAGDRVLDKDNSSTALRGIWIVQSGAWIRPPDMNGWSQVPGAFCFVEQGTANAGTGWFCTAGPTGTLNTTAMSWAQFAGPGTYTAGAGLALSGSQFSSVIGSSGGSQAWSAELDAVAALSTTGLVSRTAAHTYTPRTLQGPATGNGLSVTNADGVAGNPTIVPSDDLAALEALTGTSTIYYRSGTSAWSAVTVGGMLSFSGGTLNAAPSTDQTMGGLSSSDSLIPSQNAVRHYASAYISGLPVNGSDTLSQGQMWVWDGQSTTFRACDVVGDNLLINPALDIWQENTSYAITNSAAKTFGPDGWKSGSAGGGRTMTRVSGISGTAYAVKFQRTAGLTNASPVFFAQQFSTEETLFLAGKTVSVSFDFMPGANYSPIGGPYVRLYYGTGVNEDIDLHVAGPGFATGGGSVASGSLLGQVGASGVVTRLVGNAIAIPTGITELCMTISNGNFQSTAGADDSFTIGCIKLEISPIVSHFRKPLIGDELVRCQRRYQKSFNQATVPAQNAGALSGETRWRRFGAGAVSEVVYVPLKATMRAAPAVTIFNPAAANAQVRNETGSADCTSSSTQNVSDAGFEIVCTGNSGGAAGDLLGAHWVADSRL